MQNQLVKEDLCAYIRNSDNNSIMNLDRYNELSE